MIPVPACYNNFLWPFNPVRHIHILYLYHTYFALPMFHDNVSVGGVGGVMWRVIFRYKYKSNFYPGLSGTQLYG